MAGYSFQKKRISRGKGYAVIEAAAYRAGVRLEDRYYGLVYDYTQKSDIRHSEIMKPDGSPPKYGNREFLWNRVEELGDRTNSQLAHEIIVALQVEFTLEKQIEVTREFICDHIISRGLGADFAIHETVRLLPNGTEIRNPHAHILIPTRSIGEHGLSAIDREFNDYSTLISLRESWAKLNTHELNKLGLDGISHECLAVQDIDSVDKRETKRRLSPKEIALDREHGIQTDRVIENNRIEQRRKEKELENQLDLTHSISRGFSL
jgi:hypothetical protein